MSKLEKLIHDLCPYGVEYCTLGYLEDNNYIKLGRGNVISKQEIDSYPGQYPVYSSSAKGDGSIGKYDKFMFDDERITWSIDGGGKFFYRNNHRYSVTNVSGWLKVFSNELNCKYLYYALSNEWSKKYYNYIIKAHPSVIRDEYLIPIPPIEVQREIVRILDNFTELTTELTTELEARTKQYEYYRNKLLDFSTGSVGVPRIDVMLSELCPDGIKIRRLHEIFCQYSGMTGVSNKWALDGNCHFIDYMNVYKNLRVDVDDLKVATVKNLNQNKIQTGDILFTSASETPDECAIASEVEDEITDGVFLDDHLFALRVKEDYKEEIALGYLKYAFSAKKFRNQVIKVVRGVTRFYVSKTDFMKLTIPIPPIEVQREIVRILDNFSEYVTSISQGLPAEIEARQKQYEYYRDKLLTFKKLEV